MSWMIRGVVWSRMLVFMLFTMGVTGSVFYLLTRAVTYLFKIENPHQRLLGQKAVLCVYAVPVLFGAFFVKRMGLIDHGGITGSFWTNRMKLDDRVCTAAGLVWLGGFLAAFARTFVLQRRLQAVWKKNEAVSDPVLLEIFKEYRMQYRLKNVGFFQNNLLRSPVCVKRRGKYLIVIPDQEYTKKELHMIFTHELNHIRNRDLWWRKLAIVVGWVNWYQPLPRQLQREITDTQEFVCDLASSTDHPMYSQKEYGQFLLRLTDNEWGRVPTMALCESENRIIRRLAMMTRAKKMKRPKRWIAAAACVGLAVAAIVPAHAVSAQVIAWEESRIYATEVATEAEPQNFSDRSIERTEYADDSVTEIYASEETLSRPSANTIDWTVAANVRKLGRFVNLLVGEKISIPTDCNDDAVYRIGVKNMDTGKLTYIEGSGMLVHTFEIQTAGTYAAYVENRSRQPIQVVGWVFHDHEGNTE